MAACSCSGMYNLPMLPARTSFRTFGVPDVSSPVPLTCVKLERGRGEEEKVEHRTQSVIGVEKVLMGGRRNRGVFLHTNTRHAGISCLILSSTRQANVHS